MATRYAVWEDALIGSYMGERYGVRLGASYADVIKWLHAMRPYPKFTGKDDWDFYDATYAITHVVYTLNGYSSYQLSRHWLSAEYSFLEQNLTQAIVMEDPETMGEFLDALKSLDWAKAIHSFSRERDICSLLRTLTEVGATWKRTISTTAIILPGPRSTAYAHIHGAVEG
jgi:hypothetical protein